MFSKLGALARTDATCKSEERDLNNSQQGKKIGNKDLQLFERWERENNSAKIMGQLLMGPLSQWALFEDHEYGFTGMGLLC